MTESNATHAWWYRLRHQGMLLSPVVLLECYSPTPEAIKPHTWRKLRDANTAFQATLTDGHIDAQKVLAWLDTLLTDGIGLTGSVLVKQNAIPESLTAMVRIGSRTQTLRPHRIIFADEGKAIPAVLIMADTSPQVGRGRGRTIYSQFLELLRGTGHRLGLLTNGMQFRIVYAGTDFESWCQWDAQRWFDEGDGSEELAGLRQLLARESLSATSAQRCGLLEHIEESRTRQADLSSILRENVRQCVELLLDSISTAHRTDNKLLAPLADTPAGELTQPEVNDALMQAAARIVMRMVVCLFAESRQLLPADDPTYATSYGIRTLYEMLQQSQSTDGGTQGLANQRSAWPRLAALFRLVHGGSPHGNFPFRPYGGVLFRPGERNSGDPISRALYILERNIPINDETVSRMLRKLMRGPLPVMRGRTRTYVEGPVDYTDLRTEFIGLIYEGLLDYRIKRVDAETGPQIFLSIGREPVLPLKVLQDQLRDDPAGLKELLTKFKKEKVVADTSSSDDAEQDEGEAPEEAADEAAPELDVETQLESQASIATKPADETALQAAGEWARAAVRLAGWVGKKRARETDGQYQQRLDAEADALVKRVITPGEFYLVRAGNTRKGSGTFYTRPQLAVPTTHRTLAPLAFQRTTENILIPKTPEEILALKICDPACGSASFLVATLHYLTDALYESLCFHRNLENDQQAMRITLPFGEPRTGAATEEMIPFSPADPQRAEAFPERVKALLRRHIVERCIYGVDINPLAVELARVSLWVETMDRELPFTFLDHKIRVGNSLVGCRMDRVTDYPVAAWLRNGGDDPDTKTKGPRTKRIRDLLEAKVKPEMRRLIDGKFTDQPPLFPTGDASVDDVARAARMVFELLHQVSVADPDQRERMYQKELVASRPRSQLQRAMDEWCAVWFWPTDEESLRHVPLPLNFHQATPERDAIVASLRTQYRFFHWEIEFPDVFTPDRAGFDAVLGNPPWEVAKPASQEFFTEYDPLFRSYGKQEAKGAAERLCENMPDVLASWDARKGSYKSLSNWVANIAEPFTVTIARGGKQEAYASAWTKARAKHASATLGAAAFISQGGADLNLFKLFLEYAYRLLAPTGRLGFIVPAALYSDSGTRELRELFLNESTWEWLFSFENRKKIFAIHSSFKFAVVIVDRARRSAPLRAAFMVHHLADWERKDPPVYDYDLAAVELFSPRSKSLPEVRTPRDMAICRKIYANSVRIGDNSPGWEIKYAREFDMTNDSKLFRAREKLEAGGYKPDVFGRWIGPEGDVMLPLYEGRMIGQFDFSKKGWVRGKGRSAVWREIPFDHKTIEPQYLMAEVTARRFAEVAVPTFAFMRISSPTNSRTFMGSYLSRSPSGDSVFHLRLQRPGTADYLRVAGVCSCLAFDYIARQKIGGLNMSWFAVEELPVPSFETNGGIRRITLGTIRLTLLHRRFAPEWLRLKLEFPELATREWKQWWAVTEADRLRSRVEIDALCAGLYGLDPDDFDWIVRNDPSDPKGFWRVDKELPFRERLTGLSAAAFRSLKEGKWSADSAAKLSNDDFFAIIGIPELTNEAAAKAAGLPEPLIRKRTGCHLWEPEKFTPDDPRSGWTWDDCWNDAVALLGSEQAVQDAIKPAEAAESSPDAQEKGIPGGLFNG